jgi:hypothetical protein
MSDYLVETEATEVVVKRSFYNKGEAKGFTKKNFYEAVKDLLRGSADDKTKDLIYAAAEYELENYHTKAASSRKAAATREKKDALDSDYARALADAIVPYVDEYPRTATELIGAATAAGKLSPKGTPFALPWVARVLNAQEGISLVKKVVEKSNKDGLILQSEVTAYIRA